MSPYVCTHALDYLNSLPAQSVDLVFGSPPYEMARPYLEDGKDLGIAMKTEEWVAFMVDVFRASLRVCKGLVAYVVAGQTKKFRWSAGPALLMADLHSAGITLRNPPIYHRVGIPGSGGPDWLRSDYEPIICATNGGKLPWSDNTAMGHKPKWAPGGAMSHQQSNGTRVNQWGATGSPSARKANGERVDRKAKPSHKFGLTGRGESRPDGKVIKARAPSGTKEGDLSTVETYDPPAIANPGNVIKCKVGGGLMGPKEVHFNEAPFPERLAEFFVLSFCPPGGLVVDPFLGSGTTAAVAIRHGRRAGGCDLRQSQIDNAMKRIARETPLALFGG